VKIAVKFFVGVALIFLFGGVIGLKYIREEITPRYREAVEEQLVDISQLLAELLSRSDLTPNAVDELMKDLSLRRFRAAIFGIEKTSVDLRLIVTDESGLVVVHSHDSSRVGSDYSAWRDFALTARGEYGARTTRDDPNDPDSTVLYVSAPIVRAGNFAGVVTIGKPTRNFNQFVTRTRAQLGERVFYVCALGLICTILLATILVTRPLQKLAEYVRAIGEGRPAFLPALPRDEIGALGADFEQMRRSLEGHRYIEEYIQSLTHELKSPLTGIQGALEVVVENQDPAVKKRFTDNIRTDLLRMTKLVERMLTLASLEASNSLSASAEFSLNSMIKAVVEEIAEQQGKKLDIRFQSTEEISIFGDRLLLEQAIRNLVENALGFARSKISVCLSRGVGRAIVEIKDDGPGIPDFALARVFERFYSLPRPETGKKSTGLGLCFCKEVARLHGGELTVDNAPEGGGRSMLVLN